MDNETNNKILGVSEKDFEKIVLGILLVLTILTALFVYIRNVVMDFNMIYLIGILSTSFVARKGLSYFKPDRYYVNTTGSDELDKSQTKDVDTSSKN